VSGSPQAVVVNSLFPVNLIARVTDEVGNPIPNVFVWFRAPLVGPSCIPPVSSAVTDAAGIATAPHLQANEIAGSYTVVATIASSARQANFYLTNLPSVPASITAIADTGFRAPPRTRLPNRFRAIVRDAYANVIPYVAVRFISSLRCGTFEGGDTLAVVATDSLGKAVAPPFTTGEIPGTCLVGASVQGVSAAAPFMVTILPPVSVPASLLPTEFAVGRSFPNPFNPNTTIPIAVPHRTEVTMKVYDMLGHEVKTVFIGMLEAGYRAITWDGKSNSGSVVASGVYITRFTTNAGKTSVAKITLMR
jgi:hypothetical protein